MRGEGRDDTRGERRPRPLRKLVACWDTPRVGDRFSHRSELRDLSPARAARRCRGQAALVRSIPNARQAGFVRGEGWEDGRRGGFVWVLGGSWRLGLGDVVVVGCKQDSISASERFASLLVLLLSRGSRGCRNTMEDTQEINQFYDEARERISSFEPTRDERASIRGHISRHGPQRVIQRAMCVSQMTHVTQCITSTSLARNGDPGGKRWPTARQLVDTSAIHRRTGCQTHVGSIGWSDAYIIDMRTS